MSVQRAIYQASFDPLTNGHLWMIEQGARLFEELIVVVGNNPKKIYTFTEMERFFMAQDVCKSIHNVAHISLTQIW